MPISFGRGGTGGGGGSSKVGFANGEQTTNLDLTKNTLTAANFRTPAFQLTQKSSAKASIGFNGTVVIVFPGAGGVTGNISTGINMQVGTESSENGFDNQTSYSNVNINDGSPLVFQETQSVAGITTVHQHISGEIPFDMSILSANDNQWISFRIAIDVDWSNGITATPTSFYFTKGTIALKAFGVGAASTNVSGSDITDGTISKSKLGNNSVGTSQLENNSVTTPKIANLNVTRGKLAADAVDDTKLADNSVGSEHIKDGAVGATEINNATTWPGSLASGSVGNSQVSDNAITPAKVAGIASTGNQNKVVGFNAAGTAFEVVDKSSGGGGISTVTPTNLEGITSTDTQQFIKTNFDASGFTHQSAMGPADLNVGETGNRGQFVKVKSDGTGFETDTVSGGTPANNSITHDMLQNNIIDNDNMRDNAIDTAEIKDGAITPAKLDGTITTGVSNAGHVIALDTTNGTEFALRPYPTGGGGGGSSTFADITGVNPLSKGGTGYSASNIEDLRTHLNIVSGGTTDQALVLSTDANTQKDDTIHRYISTTSNKPSGTTEGIIVRIGDNQMLFDIDGGQWKRQISNSGYTSTWSSPQQASGLTNLTTGSAFRTLGENARGWTSTTTWLPQYLDNNRPAKVIVGRNGNYLVAIDRNNMWWVERPADDIDGGDPEWTSLSWNWEGNSSIPNGLYYTGGEADERLIPAGQDAVLSGNTGVPGENFISMMVDHSVSGTTSTFTGYFVDDNSESNPTLMYTQNTITNNGGDWARVQLTSDDIENSAIGTNQLNNESVTASKIDDDIIVEDAGSNDPVFLGIVPAISDLTFTGYTYKTSLTGGFPKGSAYFDSASRTMYVLHRDADVHLQDLFAIDYEVSIQVSDTHYVRGVFDSIATYDLPGVGTITGGVFRSADLQQVGGVIANDTTVSILGHKAVLTKTDTIGSINIDNNAVTQSKINAGAVDTTQLADGAVETAKIGDNQVTAAKLSGTSVIPSKLSGVSGGSGDGDRFVKTSTDGNTFTASQFATTDIPGITSTKVTNATAGQLLALNSGKTGFDFVTDQTGGGGGGGSGGEILEIGYQTTAMGGEGSTDFADNSTTTLNFTTPAWQVSNRATGNMLLGFGGRFDIWWSVAPTSTTTALYSIEIRYADDEAFTTNVIDWTNFKNEYLRNNSQEDSVGETAQNFTPNALIPFKLSELPTNATDGKYIQFRGEIQTFHETANRSGARFTDGYIYLMKPGGAGGSSTPADGSITNAKIANNTIELDKLASVYKVLDDSYTFQSDVSSGVDDGKFGYTDSGGNGQIAFNVKTGDSSAISEWVVDGILVLYKDATNFVIGEITATPQTEAGDSTEGAVSVIELERQGTFANGDSVKLYYGTKSPPESVLKIGNEGSISAGIIEPPAMGIPAISTYGDRIITTNSNADGFLAVPAANVGMIKASIVMRSNTGNSGNGVQLSDVSTTRVTWPDSNNMNTGTWTMQNKATDWLRCNAAGLYYFGHILAQPICVDIELWVRWRTPSANESFQAWSGGLSSSRIDVVPLGGDRLQITKLFGGGAAISNPGSSGNLVARLEPVTPPQVPDPDDRAHVDCAVPSGDKFCKLSQLNSDIADGDEVQFTAAFQKQNPSPDYTVRNFFLAIQIMDGGHTYANF